MEVHKARRQLDPTVERPAGARPRRGAPPLREQRYGGSSVGVGDNSTGGAQLLTPPEKETQSIGVASLCASV